MITLSQFIALLFLFPILHARDIIKLEAVNFELALTSYPYVAILFYDDSNESKLLEKNWEDAGNMLEDFNMDGELAKVHIAYS